MSPGPDPNRTLTMLRLPSFRVSEDDPMAIIAAISSKKLDRQIAEQTARRAKYEVEKEKVHSMMEVEKLKQQERVLKLQHQREREKEAHTLEILRMQLDHDRNRNAGPSTRTWTPAQPDGTVPDTQ